MLDVDDTRGKSHYESVEILQPTAGVNLSLAVEAISWQ